MNSFNRNQLTDLHSNPSPQPSFPREHSILPVVDSESLHFNQLYDDLGEPRIAVSSVTLRDEPLPHTTLTTRREVSYKTSHISRTIPDSIWRCIKATVWLSLIGLVIELPSIIAFGSWPAMIAELKGNDLSNRDRIIAHSITAGAMLILLVSLCILVWVCHEYRFGSALSQYGPFVLTYLGTLFIMANHVRQVLQDTGAWPTPESDIYQEDCSPAGFKCLSAVGWVFTSLTWTGVLCMLAGSIWNAATASHAVESKTWSSRHIIQEPTLDDAMRAPLMMNDGMI